MWNKLVDACGVCLASTVVAESAFFEDERGERHAIDLREYISTNRVRVFEAQPNDMAVFFNQFDAVHLEKPDAGEAESLCDLLTAPDQRTRIGRPRPASGRKRLFRRGGPKHGSQCWTGFLQCAGTESSCPHVDFQSRYRRR